MAFTGFFGVFAGTIYSDEQCNVIKIKIKKEKTVKGEQVFLKLPLAR
jgi:hypothetical protein